MPHNPKTNLFVELSVDGGVLIELDLEHSFAGTGVPELGLQRGDFVVVQFSLPLNLFQLNF
jgi:hypothetical protein